MSYHQKSTIPTVLSVMTKGLSGVAATASADVRAFGEVKSLRITLRVAGMEMKLRRTLVMCQSGKDFCRWTARKAHLSGEG